MTAHGNQRLSNLARQGGFPAAAMASGASWPRKFLERAVGELLGADVQDIGTAVAICERKEYLLRSEEHTSELQSLMRISYAVFCLKTQTHTTPTHNPTHT